MKLTNRTLYLRLERSVQKALHIIKTHELLWKSHQVSRHRGWYLATNTNFRKLYNQSTLITFLFITARKVRIHFDRSRQQLQHTGTLKCFQRLRDAAAADSGDSGPYVTTIVVPW